MQAVDKTLVKVLLELSKIDILKEHYLAGGTNLALRYNHRTSIDLDFFIHRDMNLDDSNYLNLKLREIFKDRFESNSVSKVGVFGFIDKVKLDFVNYPYPLIHPTEILNGAKLAHPLDIAGMKINAIVGRGSRKDFFDLHHMMSIYPIDSLIDNYKLKYGLDNIQQAKMALVYFEDGEDINNRDNKFIPIKDISWNQIKKDIVNAVNDFENSKIVNMAVFFHQNTNYQGKTPNITAYYPNGALSRAFYQKYGIQLTKEQLHKVDKSLDKKQNRNRGRSI